MIFWRIDRMLTDQDWQDKQEAAMLRQLAPKDDCTKKEKYNIEKLYELLKEIQATTARMEQRLANEKPFNKYEGWFQNQ